MMRFAWCVNDKSVSKVITSLRVYGVGERVELLVRQLVRVERVAVMMSRYVEVDIIGVEVEVETMMTDDITEVEHVEE